ncbi:MAG TPA: branched-chain amino acid transaminase [Thermoanaerobaculia bacterium]|nr:branched-chain amino acid transaminase [Thermoanaerobaculia bacterium]
MNKGPFEEIKWVWMNGQLVEFEKATVHVMAHALHYGSGLFEGIRCYRTPQGPAVFRLDDHLKRLENSCKVYRMDLPYGRDELTRAVFDSIRTNGLEECYIRPIAFRGFGTVGINPMKSPVEVAIAVWPWGRYLGDDAIENGVDVCVSTWRRTGLGGSPALAKATGNYLNSQLIKMEAVSNGYAEGIALDTHGYVSEGSGENVFLVQDGVLYTPPVSSSILPGITRHSIQVLAEEMGVEVRRVAIPRGMLYTCDEAFFTGTAVEVTPIRSVDRLQVGDGKPGPVTRRLIEEFLAITRGATDDRHGWLARVPAAVAPAAI